MASDTSEDTGTHITAGSSSSLYHTSAPSPSSMHTSFVAPPLQGNVAPVLPSTAVPPHAPILPATHMAPVQQHIEATSVNVINHGISKKISAMPSMYIPLVNSAGVAMNSRFGGRLAIEMHSRDISRQRRAVVDGHLQRPAASTISCNGTQSWRRIQSAVEYPIRCKHVPGAAIRANERRVCNPGRALPDDCRGTANWVNLCKG